jgi:O-antigen/teichoic acid export membrane protein
MVGNRVILRNIGVLTIAQALSLGAAVFTAALLARALGPDAYGILGFGVACLSFLGIFVTLGTDIYGARQVARARDRVRALSGEIIGLRFILAVVAYGAFYLFVQYLDRTASEKTVLLIQGGGVFVIAMTLDYAFQGLERMGVNGFRQVATAFLTLAGVALFVREPADVTWAALVVLGAGLIAVFAVFTYANRALGPVVPRFSAGAWRRIVAVSAPMAISGVTYTIITNTDIAMLGLMRTNGEVGLYSAAFRINAVAIVPVGLVLAAFFPSLSESFSRGREAMVECARQSSTAILFAGVPVIAGGILFSAEILSVLFGPQFDGARTTLILLMVSALALHARFMFDPGLLAWNAERTHMKIALAGAAVNVILNLVFIPAYGIEGAATASLLSHLCAAVAFAIAFKRITGVIDLKPWLPPAVCVVPSIAAGWAVREALIGVPEWGASSLVLLLAGGAAFGAVYISAYLVYRWQSGRRAS